MNVLVWHVHGSWMTAFVQGEHRYLVPTVADRGPDGLGRARTWCWPDTVEEVCPEAIGDHAIDAIIVQRPRDVELYEQWTGRSLAERGGPAVVWVEHDTPMDLHHPVHRSATVNGIDALVHVTRFNDLMWWSSERATHVIEHGVVDPGHRYTGELPHAVATINEPIRRSWTAGSDLLAQVRRQAPVDLFGMQTEALGGRDVTQSELHDEMARRRVYLHTFRWTSLGLSLVEAMHLGMPVVAVAATEAPRAVPPTAGILANDAQQLTEAVCALLDDPARCHQMGAAARDHALAHHSLGTFLERWDDLLHDVVRARR